MTNEEMAVRVQKGDFGFDALLWEHVEKLARLMARRYYTRSKITCIRAGVQLEDLEQAAYLAMMDAVKGFKLESGYKFTTYLRRQALNRWGRMLDIRTGQKSFDPLNRCVSLETPISTEDDSITLEDAIPDREAEQAIEDSLERVYNEQLHAVMESCLATLEDMEADTIRGRFYNGETFKEIAVRRGCTIDQARKMEANGLRGLRHPKNSKRLKAWREDIVSAGAYKGGLIQFRRSGGSSVEITVEKLDGIERGERENR